MKLRKLELKDAPLMLEWMHDKDVTANMNRDFSSLSIEDCERFISNSVNNKQNVHMAVVDDNDEYLGTVSLKSVDYEKRNAEFAITIRKCAMGRGVSSYAMQEIIRIGIEEMNLDCVYWCVSPVNVRAVKFYDKNDYKRVDYHSLGVDADYDEELINEFIWYCVQKKY